MRRLILIFATLLFAVPALAADISGTWNADVKTDAGSGTPVFVLKQTGETISGTYTGQLGEAKVTGTVKGDEVHIQFDVGAPIIYVGKLDASGTKMSGTVDLGGQATGTFTAAKK